MTEFLIVLFWLALLLLIYAQVGYPVLMALAARLPKRGMPAVADTPKVTLIIPAYNEEAVIEAKLRNALEIAYPRDRLEIVVASDGSDDATVEIARRFEAQGVRVFAFPQRRGKPSVLNDAVQATTGDVLLLCDANVLFRPDALQRLVAHLGDDRVGAVTGDVRLASADSNFGEGESLYYRIERMVQLGESRLGSVMAVDGGMYVLRRQLYRPLPADALNEDFTATMRVARQGKKVVYDPEAVAVESATPTALNEFRRRIRVTCGAVAALRRGEYPPVSRPILLWQFVSHKLLRWLGPLWLIAIMVASILLWNAGAIYRAGLVAQIIFYGTAIVATVWHPLRDTRLGGGVFYFVMSHVAMAIGWGKGLLNLQAITWNRTERTALPECSEGTEVS